VAKSASASHGYVCISAPCYRRSENVRVLPVIIQAGSLVFLILVFFFCVITFDEVSKFVVVGPEKSCAPRDAGGVLMFDAPANLNFSINCEIPSQVIIKFNRHQEYDRFALCQFWAFDESALLDIGGLKAQRDFMQFEKRPHFSNIYNSVMYSELRSINTVKPYKPDMQLRAMCNVEFIARDFKAASSSFGGHSSGFIGAEQKSDLDGRNDRQECSKYAQNESVESDRIIPCSVPNYRQSLPRGFGYLLFIGGLVGLCVGLLYVLCLWGWLR
jgi:hypothetical protein